MQPEPQSPAKAGQLWNEQQTAQFLGVSVEFLQADRGTKGGRRIAFVKIGRAVRYDPADVVAYKDSCKVPARSARE